MACLCILLSFLKRIFPSFICSDLDNFFNIGYKDFPVSGIAGMGILLITP